MSTLLEGDKSKRRQRGEKWRDIRIGERTKGGRLVPVWASFGPLDSGRQTYKMWWGWNKRSTSCPMEKLHSVVTGAQVLFWEGEDGPVLMLQSMLPTRVVGLLSRNWHETRQEIQARLYWDSYCRGGSKNKCSLAHSLCGGWRGGSLYEVRIEAHPGVRPKGWRRWSAHPLRGAMCRGACVALAFAASVPAVLVGFLVFLYLVPNLPQLHMHTATFSPL